MGEIHYSRYPDSGWKEALLKMKEGGVDIVSSYVIWIHHEEIENQFEWTGWRDLRKFVQTIKECGLSMILRIGPWSHAEVRHGGFPDWLLAKCPDARNTNDEKYFAEVEKFYKAIYEQVKGLLLKDGGPIIGVQIENEFGHCGGLTGDAGEAHMKRLEKWRVKLALMFLCILRLAGVELLQPDFCLLWAATAKLLGIRALQKLSLAETTCSLTSATTMRLAATLDLAKESLLI